MSAILSIDNIADTIYGCIEVVFNLTLRSYLKDSAILIRTGWAMCSLRSPIMLRGGLMSTKFTKRGGHGKPKEKG